jgi:hypothetical protein
MGNWLLVQADSRRRPMGSNWESKNAEAESAYCAQAPLALGRGTSRLEALRGSLRASSGQAGQGGVRKAPGYASVPWATKPVVLLNGLMSRLKPRPAGVRRWRNPKSPGQPRPFYTCAFAPGQRAPWATRLRRDSSSSPLADSSESTAYGIGDALTCGGWRRGRARGRGAEREDAIARGRMRVRSRSCCRRPDTRFSR